MATTTYYLNATYNSLSEATEDYGYGGYYKVGLMPAFADYVAQNGAKPTYEIAWACDFYIEGTWPSITIRSEGIMLIDFLSTANRPWTHIYSFGLGLYSDTETNKQYTPFISTGNTQRYLDKSPSAGLRVAVLAGLSGEIERTFTFTSTSKSFNIAFCSSFKALADAYGNESDAYWKEGGSTYLTFTFRDPTLSLSTKSVESDQATVKATSVFNEGCYWRFKAQWKLSTASSWSTSSTAFEATSSTFERTLTGLEPNTKYNYRFAYVDRDGTIQGYTSSITFTTAEDQAKVYINSGGTVKQAKVWYNDGGTIKKVKKIYYNQSGTIKTVK